MSTIFTLTGKSSILTATFDPPLFLDESSDYVMGLLNFETYNTITNIKPPRNEFHLVGRSPIIIPEGAYEITDIDEYLRTQLEGDTGDYVLLRGNNSTLTTRIKSTFELDFTSDKSIGYLLGFNQKRYSANTWHNAENITQILQINSLLLHCNISVGSYKNGTPGHIIHQFFPTVPPGYKIVESPNPVIYLPISTKTITDITVKILDQDDNPVSFGAETVTVGLHLKKL